MDDFIGVKDYQAYEVTDFQRNFEIDRILTSDMQQYWYLYREMSIFGLREEEKNLSMAIL